jgi:hypothetical protein
MGRLLGPRAPISPHPTLTFLSCSMGWSTPFRQNNHFSIVKKGVFSKRYPLYPITPSYQHCRFILKQKHKVSQTLQTNTYRQILQNKNNFRNSSCPHFKNKTFSNIAASQFCFSRSNKSTTTLQF